MDDHTELIRQQRNLKRYTRSGRSGVGTGTISLLMIFTVLCFATLALLSLSTAASDRRIQQRGFERTQNLAAAEGRAAEKLAELDGALLALPDDAAGADGYLAAALTAARGFGWEVDAAAASCQWTEPIDSENDLVTTIRLGDGDEDARYTLTGQATVYVGSWEAEESGGVWIPPAAD